MSGKPSQDVRPLVTVVAGLILASLLGAARSHLGLAHQAQEVLPLVLIPASLLAMVALVCRVVVTRRSLASRVRLVVFAPDTFDPSLDAVLRCAAQLSRVRRLVGGWLDPRARAVRVLLDCDEDGRMRYSLSVPERALPAVRSALGAFDRVQVQVIDEKQEPAREGADRVEVVRAELRLARPSSEPLAHLGAGARSAAGLREGPRADRSGSPRAGRGRDRPVADDRGDSQTPSPPAAQGGSASRRRRREPRPRSWAA